VRRRGELLLLLRLCFQKLFAIVLPGSLISLFLVHVHHGGGDVRLFSLQVFYNKAAQLLFKNGLLIQIVGIDEGV
jgi:hypothetical protein